MPSWKRALLFGGGVTVVALSAAAAAPIAVAAGAFGAFGVVTGCGAGFASAFGAVGAMGVAFSDYYSSAQVRDAQKIAAGYAVRTAQQAEVIDQLLAKLRGSEAAARDWTEFSDDMIRLGRVLVGAACADVELGRAGSAINSAEIECIRTTLFSASSLKLPTEYKARVQQVLAERVSLEQALKSFKKLRSSDLRELTRSLLPMVMMCDAETGQIHHREQSFLDGWDRYIDGEKIVV